MQINHVEKESIIGYITKQKKKKTKGEIFTEKIKKNVLKYG